MAQSLLTKLEDGGRFVQDKTLIILNFGMFFQGQSEFHSQKGSITSACLLILMNKKQMRHFNLSGNKAQITYRKTGGAGTQLL